MALYNSLLFLHLLGIVIWVGGMFLMHVVVRPGAAALLEPPQRLPFLAYVMGQFFLWVGVSIALVLLSGLGMLHVMQSWDELSPSIYAMAFLGLGMMAIYGHVRFACYPRLRTAVAAKDWPAAAVPLATIRRLIGMNLVLGLLTIALATLGRLLG